MRMKTVAGMWMLVAMLTSAAAFAQAPPAQTREVALYFSAEVLADGALANVQPDASLAPALQAMVRKRVAEWRYEPSTWQGKRVSTSISQKIVTEVVPAASAGFMLRIKQVTGASMPAANDVPGVGKKMYPPEYPQEARRRGVAGTFIYAMRVDAQGTPYDIELLAPEPLGRDMKTLEQASRTAIAKWTLETPRADGVPVDCRAIVPIQFALGPYDAWDKTALALYRARFADACPAAPELLTKVAGTLL